MSAQIQAEHFTNSLYALLDEAFDNVHGYFLDKGTSMFETLATISAEEASRPVGGKCATLAAQVKHVAFYLDVVERSVRTLEQSLQRHPTLEEVADATGMVPEGLKKLWENALPIASLEEPIGESEDTTLGWTLEDPDAPSPEEEAASSMLHEEVDRALDTLPPRHAMILRLRFGLRDGRMHTLAQIAERLGVSRERVRQLEAEALNRLRTLKGADAPI